MSGLSRRRPPSQASSDVRVPDAVVVHLDRQLGGGDTERREHLVRAVVGSDGRHRLRHLPVDDPPGLVPLELDGDDAGAGLEGDHAELERRTEHERGAEARMPGERDLVAGREDPDPHRAAFARRQHEDRLGEAELERQLLHRHARRGRARP